jgi:hypothetical protein
MGRSRYAWVRSSPGLRPPAPFVRVYPQLTPMGLAFDFSLQFSPMFDPAGGELAGGNGSEHGAVGFVQMRTVVETALPGKRDHVGERASEAVDPGEEPDRPDPGNVDDCAAAW